MEHNRENRNGVSQTNVRLSLGGQHEDKYKYFVVVMVPVRAVVAVFVRAMRSIYLRKYISQHTSLLSSQTTYCTTVCLYENNTNTHRVTAHTTMGQATATGKWQAWGVSSGQIGRRTNQMISRREPRWRNKRGRYSMRRLRTMVTVPPTDYRLWPLIYPWLDQQLALSLSSPIKISKW